MIAYQEKIELEQNKETLSKLIDEVLDIYKNHPKECDAILMELNNISNEFDEIEKEIEELEEIEKNIG